VHCATKNFTREQFNPDPFDLTDFIDFNPSFSSITKAVFGVWRAARTPDCPNSCGAAGAANSALKRRKSWNAQYAGTMA
jgi:hypothetical protein